MASADDELGIVTPILIGWAHTNNSSCIKLDGSSVNQTMNKETIQVQFIDALHQN